MPRRPSTLCCLVVAVLAFGCGGPPTGAPPRGIFLIVVDTLRADRLSCYGFEGHVTPHIDGLAARGVRFTRANAVASWTVPSMGALFTSWLPRRLGLLQEEPGQSFSAFELRKQRSLSLPADTPHLAEELRRLGYRTVGFVDQPMLDHHSGFQRGFDDWYHVVSRGQVRRFDPDAGDSSPSWDDTPYAYQNDAALVQHFAKWLAALGSDDRVFAWLHLLTPHTPYLPPPEFASGVGEGRNAAISPAAYAGEVRAVDSIVGRALHAIDAHVGRDRALVLLTSDHGEALGDHGELGHGQSFHREVIHVPLLVAGSGLPVGVAVDALVRTIDIAPTILTLAGAEAGHPGFEGRSLLPLLDDVGLDRELYAEGVLYGPTERSLVSNGYKLLVDDQSGRAQLFSLAQDPAERRDVSAERPEQVRQLRERLEAIAASVEEASATRTTTPSDLTERDRAALRALGYLEEQAGEGQRDRVR